MMKTDMKLLIGATVGATLLLSNAQAAQAPVYDLSDAGLAEKLVNLERVVNSRTRNQQRVQEQINGLQTEISEIRGKIEEQNFQIEKILQRQRELLLAFDVQSQQQQEAAKLLKSATLGQNLTSRSANPSVSIESNNSDRPNTSTTQPATSSSRSGNSVSSQNENDAVDYKAAVDLILKQRDTQAAIPALEQFVQNYPQSSFRPNAHYWLGQIFYNERKWQKASTHFKMLYSQFSTSNKVSDATLKLGIIAKNLGDNVKAREYFTMVIENHANTTSAKLAQEQINML